MPQITIDGKQYEYEGKHMLLQFALDNGIEIPYFCYHPAMSSPTNCRMCLVEVGFPVKDRQTGEVKLDEAGKPLVTWGRKPNTACNTPLGPDMIVKTNRTSQQVDEMQKGVLEYMLVNHPLDCPICDQAGECPLQIWTYKYGPEGSRFETNKAHRPKRVELGPNVILDAERCINCTRCTRFTEEISGSGQLSIVGRGEKNYPSTGPGAVFDDPYSMNVIDLCPVGALTSRDFRFKARVWEMAYTPGICTGCAKGCNIDVWVRDNEVLRLTPRDNLKINQYWMCDEGRLAIGNFNTHRVSGLSRRGDLPYKNLDEGISAIAKILRDANSPVFFLGSSHASLESNFALRKLATAMGVDKVFYVPHISAGWGDNFLRKDDRAPNTAGCELLGFESISMETLKSNIESGKIPFFYMLEDQGVLGALAHSLKGITSIVHATNRVDDLAEADFVLPAAMSIEAEATYVNADRIPQVTKMAKEITRMTPEMWMRLPKSRLDKAAVAVDRWRNVGNVVDALPSWQLIAMIAFAMGKDWGFKDHKAIFAEMKSGLEALKDIEVSYKVPKEAFKSTQFDFAIK